MLEGPSDTYSNMIQLKEECIELQKVHSARLKSFYVKFQLFHYSCINKKYRPNDKLQELCQILTRYHSIVHYELKLLNHGLNDLCELFNEFDNKKIFENVEDKLESDRYHLKCKKVIDKTKSVFGFLLNPNASCDLFEALAGELLKAEIREPEFEEVDSLENDLEECFSHVSISVFENLISQKERRALDSSDSFDSLEDNVPSPVLMNQFQVAKKQENTQLSDAQSSNLTNTKFKK